MSVPSFGADPVQWQFLHYFGIRQLFCVPGVLADVAAASAPIADRLTRPRLASPHNGVIGLIAQPAEVS